MPVLILLGIGAVCGVTALVSKHKPSQKYDINMSEQEKTKRVFENNNKRIDKIMRKYRWWNVPRCSSCHSAGMGYIRLSEILYTSSTANRWLRRTYQNTVTNEQPERTSTVSQAKKQAQVTHTHLYTYNIHIRKSHYLWLAFFIRLVGNGDNFSPYIRGKPTRE